jgi:amino acid adenylation domain-containing protein
MTNRWQERFDDLDPNRRALVEKLLRARSSRSRSTIAVSGAASHPLSFSQEALWFLQTLTPGAAYNVPIGVAIRGELNTSAVEASLRLIQTRHSVLSARILTRDGVPFQELSDRRAVFELLDCPPHSRDIQAQLARFAAAPFDIARGPLWRAQLARLATQEHFLLLVFHHLAFDGWSIERLLNEFRIVYPALCSGLDPTPRLPNLPLQYGDYATWQRDRLDDAALTRLVASFRATQPLSVPVAWRANTLDPPHAGPPSKRAQTWAIDAPLDRAVDDFARRERLTRYVVLLTAFNTALAELEKSDNVPIAVPIANRSVAEVSNLIGCFSNTLIMACDLKGSTGFRDAVSRVNRSMLSLREFEELPLQRLARNGGTERVRGLNPFASVAFAIQEFPRRFALQDIDLEVVDVSTGEASIEVSATVRTAVEGAELLLEYCPERVANSSIERLGSLFKQALAAGVGMGSPYEADAPSVVRVECQLSRAQTLMALAQERYGDCPLYNQQMAVRIAGPLDVPRFQRALRQLVAVTDALRSSLERSGTDWRLVVSEPAFDDAEVIDARGTDPSAIFAMRAQVPLWQRRRPWDSIIIRTEDEAYVWLLTIHHCFIDGHGFSELVRRLQSAYQADGSVSEETLPSFATYVRERAEKERGGAFAASAEYWRAKLGQPAEELRFYGQLRGTESTLVLEQQCELEPQKVAALGAASRALQLSVFSREQALATAILTCLIAALRRATGMRSLNIGVALSNRSSRDERRIVGSLMSIGAIRASTERHTLATLARQVQSSWVDLLRHGDFIIGNPWERRNYDVLFNLVTLPRLALDGLRTRVEFPSSGHQYDRLAVHVELDGELVALKLHGQRGVFDAPSLERLARDLSRAIDVFAQAPHENVEVFAEGTLEEALVAVGSGKTRVTRSAELWTGFQARIREHVGIAIEAGAERVSYPELDRRVRCWAHALRNADVRQGMPVLHALPRGANAVAALLATLDCGAVHVPIEGSIPLQRLAAVLESVQARVAVAEGSIAEVLAGHGLRVFTPSSLCDKPAPGSAPPIVHDSVHPAYVMFTSGTTGSPKGVVVPRAALSNFVAAAIGYMGLGPADRVLQFASMAFDTSLEEILPTLVAGGTLVIRDEAMLATTSSFIERVEALGITVLDLPTAVWNVLGRSPATRSAPPSVSRLRLVVIGGETAEPSALESWLRSFPNAPVLNTYGPTEGCVVATTQLLGANELGQPALPLGRCIEGARILILNEQLRPVPQGVWGEICVGGHGVATGYLGRSRETAERFVPDPLLEGARLYRTGDRGRVRSDGTLDFGGRIDRQLKIRGFRVEPGEIESVLGALPGVARTAVLFTGRTGSSDGFLEAFVELQSGVTPTSDELVASLRQRLPSYMVPRVIQVVDALPVTTGGKVDYAALVNLRRTASPISRQAPRNEDEVKLIEIWGQVLDTDAARIGVDDNFFDLGGHSLLATVLLSRIAEAFGAELPLSSLFERPTPEGNIIAILSSKVRGLSAEQREEVLSGIGVTNFDQTPEMLENHVRELDAPQRSTLMAILRDRDSGGDVRRVAIQRRARETYPLSNEQRRLWFLQRLKPAATEYNVTSAVLIRGEFCVDRAIVALAAVVSRHEILRTRFVEVGADPVQQIRSQCDLDVRQLDVAKDSQLDTFEEIRRLALEESKIPFDLTSGVPLRSRFLKCDSGTHAVVITMHHIVADGWSVGLLVDELTTIYEALSTNNVPPLAPLPIQYGDYALWQSEQLTKEKLHSQLEFWRKTLAEAPPPLRFPVLGEQPSGGAGGAIHVERFSRDVCSEVSRLARQAGVTEYVVLLSAWVLLLYRWTLQDDLVIGTPVANRQERETSSLIGFFVNTLVLRIKVSAAGSVTGLLESIQRMVLDALANKDVPFDEVHRVASARHDHSWSSLFNVMFTYLNEPTRRLLKRDAIDWQVVDFDRRQANRALTLRIEDDHGALTAHLEHDLASIPKTVGARLLSAYVTLLTSVLDAPESRVRDLALPPQLARAEEEVRNARRGSFEKLLKRGAAISRQDSLVQDRPFWDDDQRLLLVRPARADVDLATWLRHHGEWVTERLCRHGAILFRGFEIEGTTGFGNLGRALSSRLEPYAQASSPRTHVGGHVYTSTEYPASENIMLHNELSYSDSWPAKIWFYCRVASRGGGTPIVDGRQVFTSLDSEVREAFVAKRVRYQRTYGSGTDLPWPVVFGTSVRSEVEAYCRAHDIRYEWYSGDGLRTYENRQSVLRHGRTGELVWFNSAHMFHVHAHGEATRTSLRRLFAPNELPRHAFFGDGSSIPDDYIVHIRETYAKLERAFEWQPGDALLLDNVLTAHGREPYRGPREIFVCMAEAEHERHGESSPCSTLRSEEG